MKHLQTDRACVAPHYPGKPTASELDNISIVWLVCTVFLVMICMN